MRGNRHTLALAAVLVAMWYAAAAQTNGAVYLLAFACAGMALLSWLHAKANLRDIDIQAGDLVLNQRSGCYRLPFRLMARSRRAASGIEIAAAKAKASVFIGQLQPGVPFRSELSIPAAGFDPTAPVTLLVRSLYPLGFFTAELRLPVVQTKRAAPFPKGELPLPPPVKSTAGSSGHTSGMGARGVSGNDDFAGVRAWQPGDSPRHIDWKAVARERPMMTKQWTGNQDAFVKLEWESLSLPDEDKIGQLARWVHDCEAQGTRYTLVLPDKTIPVGAGALHMQRCLEALGGMTSRRLTASDSKKRQHIPFVHETTAAMSMPPTWMLGVALLLTLVPMIGTVSFVAMALFLLAVAIRIERGARISPVLVRLAFVIVGGVAVYLTEKEYRSMEAATALLLVFIGGKFIESRTPRDFQVVGLLGWFLCMCGLALEQSLGWSLYTAAVFLFITATFVRLRLDDAGIRKPSRVAFALMAQALPIMALMFLFFPRGTEDFVARLARRNMSTSGLSSNLEPGSVARVALSDALAFRAEIADGNIIRLRDRYWRCMVLWECDGLTWRRGGGGSGRSGTAQNHSKTIRQIITVEPHGNYWLPALDRPLGLGKGAGSAQMGDDETVFSSEPVDGAKRFTVVSSTAPQRSNLSESDRRAALRTPQNISGHVENLALSFRKSADVPDRDVVEAALDYLRTEGFKYTLEPGTYGGNALEDFLFNRRLGFCEHFSAAFGTLMRLAGVPARVVVGYVGGEDTGRGYLRVRQCDAHAWTEVWLKETGWMRVDPTAELAPDRLSSDLETYLAGGLDSTFAMRRQTWWWTAWTETRLLWDRLDYEWYNRIISADTEAQLDTLLLLGLSKLRWSALLGVLAVGIVLVSSFVFLWLRRSARHPDPAARLWLSVCKRLAKAGLARMPDEGASAFAARAGAAFPSAAPSLRQISERYNDLRYGPGSHTLAELKLAIKQMPGVSKRDSLT